MLTNFQKSALLAMMLICTGALAAHNAKWVREGSSPWWTSYFFSIVTSSSYAYLLRANLFSLCYTSTFQTFFFHASWYFTTLFVLGEHIKRYQGFGLALVFAGMILMSVK